METGLTTGSSTRVGDGGALIPPTTGNDSETSHSTAELLPGTCELITAVRRRLLAGHVFNNPTFTELTAEHLGGSRMRGTFSPKYAYDVLEVAVNGMLLGDRARALMGMEDPLLGLTHVLRPLMGQLPRQTDRTHEQQLLQQFSSPPTLAFIAARVLNPRPDDIVIEPSAGTGSQFGARHFETMLKRLAIGGRLVGIAGEGMRLDKPGFTAWWQEVARRYTVRAVVGLNGREYAKLGTSFDNCLIVIDKTGPTPGESWERQLQFVRWGNVERLEEAWAILSEIAADRPAKGGVRHEANATSPKSVPVVGVSTQPVHHDDTALTGEAMAAPTFYTEIVPSPTLQAQAGGAEAAEIAAQEQPTPNADNAESEDDADIFVTYTPAMLTGGVAHPALIVESRSMGSVYPPPITYRPHFPLRVVTRGLLSALQLERVCYAGQAHEQRLPNGARGGFFVGDGTGVGKGRILAGIIVDNWFQGCDRAVWFSVNNDLMDSARRDLNDLGVKVPLHKINDFDVRKPITAPPGVIFSSYNSLISSAKSGETRLAQLQEWLGPNGVIIFDEAHKAKNALASGRGEPTQTGQAG